MSDTLVFVYNADSGVFNTLADLAHKTLSPATYSCNLCAITYSSFGMRREWRAFLEGLDVAAEFLHRDELGERYGVAVPLPAIFLKRGSGALTTWVDAATLNTCASMEDLQRLIAGRLAGRDGAP